MTNEKTIGLGTKVRTAADVVGAGHDGSPMSRRRPGVRGEVIGLPIVGPDGTRARLDFAVRHEDGSTAPYACSELTPIADEKAAPTTPIGRLRATICDVTGASLFIDQWEKIDAALREVETQIADLQRKADGVGAARAVVALTAPSAMTDERLLELREGVLGCTAEGREALAEVDRLRAIEAIRIADVEAVLQRHAAAVGAVGPMPVEKAAEVVALCEGCEQPAADGHRCASEPVEAARPRVGGWVDEAPVRRCYDDRGRQVGSTCPAKGGGFAWFAARPFLPAAEGKAATQPGAGRAALAVLATWADVEGQHSGDGLTGDERLMAEQLERAARYTGAGRRPDPDAARLAAVHRWIASLPRERHHEAARRASVSYSDERTAVERGARIEGDDIVWPDGERYPRRTVEAPPLSLVVAFGSEGAPVILEAAGPWEGIEERPLPPARGLWRWVGKAVRTPEDRPFGWLLDGAWTLLQVPA